MLEYENLNKVNAPYEAEFIPAFKSFLENGMYILNGEVDQFEKEFARYCGSRYCVGVASGFDAMYLSILTLDLPKNSEILVPSNTYIATIFSIIKAGYKPVLVEPEIRSYNIDPEGIEAQISSRTRAIMIVHLYGRPCELDPIISIANQYGLTIIEDCAQAHGATYRDKKVGSFGTTGAFSFYPTKNLGALGDGGAIVTDNEEIAAKLKALRNYGSETKYFNKYIGINSRLDELQAAFLRIKLRKLEKVNDHKRKLAEEYLRKIVNSEIVLPIPMENGEAVWHIFNVRHPRRDELKKFLLTKGIGTEIHYPLPPHQQSSCKKLFRGQQFPLSELIHQTTLSLPISTFHTVNDIEYISEVISKSER
ncbi:DegT/DnrJ/EryC1/StrS family aminotransferase [Daejeonella lutea]|uniref:dTDP-4-amino-4,6-dideoxygalactose transaminase n=1 Tax=Daejeonella lutea TaxID=572036 RepID=A0A1T5DZ48_9SPHI|nr:DegT/DnrJ/EryC1/StrS family aminotransferase [Daejeonella lutea]SKB76786.1 dTDP-4-amino-4,6-dideoxygalactose transaminase [Daejeonella lutea]